MTTIEKAALPRRKPKGPTTSGPDAPAVEYVIHFSFNNTVDPSWTLALDAEPTTRRERRLSRTAAANERARHARTTG